MTINIPQCIHCKNLYNKKIRLDPIKCVAYPDGVPWEILTNKVDHKHTYLNDNGIRYEEEKNLDRLDISNDKP